MSNSPEGQALMAWRTENPAAPRDWLVLADRLASHPDMPVAWAELRKRGEDAKAVFSDVCSAFRYANLEVRRPRLKKEREQFERVRAAARELQRAIQSSSLPKNSGTFARLTCEGLKDINLVIGWRDLAEDGYGFGYPLAVSDFLDFVVTMVDRESEKLPPRSIARQRKRWLESAFVRWMTFYMIQRFGDEMHATVARISSAALNLADPLDKKDVEAFLRDSPKAFRTKQRNGQDGAS